MADPFAATFRKPFDEQVAAFRLRMQNLAPTSAWDDLWKAEHDRAFMVAGAVKADLLADLAAAVDRTISEGKSLEAFRKDFRAIVERNGWHGWTGEDTAQGQAWRTRTIYKTNLSTSYAAGRHAQLTKAGFEFWVYVHSGALHPRLDHQSWNGVVLKADHPFWKAHYPPNGWGCGCKVFGARSLRGARRVGGDPDKALPEGWESIDPRTGEQVGIGKGWGYAPGASVSETVSAMTSKTVHWPFELAKAYTDQIPQDLRDSFARSYRELPSVADDTRRYVERVLGERNGAPIDGPVIVEQQRLLGILDSAQVEQISALTGRDVSGYNFSMAIDEVRHAFSSHGDPKREATRGQIAITPEDLGLLPAMLNAPDRIAAGGTTDMGLPIVLFHRDTARGRYTAAMEVRGRKRRMLALKSFWIGVPG